MLNHIMVLKENNSYLCTRMCNGPITVQASVESGVKVESAAVAIFGEGPGGGQQRWRVRNSG